MTNERIAKHPAIKIMRSLAKERTKNGEKTYMQNLNQIAVEQGYRKWDELTKKLNNTK